MSSLQHARLGGVALSLPSIVGPDGVAEVLMPEMSAAEQAGLRRSAELLDQAHRSLSCSRQRDLPGRVVDTSACDWMSYCG